jgi:predicted enzyme related to lactoylglutathione lyase
MFNLFIPMPRVIHFEIQASDIERAIGFYKSVFGWEFNRLDSLEYCLIITGQENERGINGGLVKRASNVPHEGSPSRGYICTIDVPSADEYCKRVVDAGGAIEMDKLLIPGAGWLVYCRDTENNIFGMIEMASDSD